MFRAIDIDMRVVVLVNGLVTVSPTIILDVSVLVCVLVRLVVLSF